MKFIRFLHYFLLMIFWMWTGFVNAQSTQPLALLEQDYPLLIKKFGEELKMQRANYLFAIDVSGTMNRYENIVVPAMSQFVESLTDGDNVNIIRFGTDAKVSLGGFSDISQETKKSLTQYISTLYKRDPELYTHTDLNRLLDQINKQLQIQKNNLTFIFVLTDFINDPTNSMPKLTQKLCSTHRQRLEARAVDHSMYMYALQLPVEGANDLQLFKTAIPDSYHFEEFSITSPASLKNWFDRKKAEILLDKFYAIVQRKNEALHFSTIPSLDIDGNLSLDISWQPNELFEMISVDTVTLQHAGEFQIKGADKLPVQTIEACKHIEVGRVKHVLFGFHLFADTLNITGSLPTKYDNELEKLEISKPIVVARSGSSRWLFSCIIPLWLLSALIIVLIFYFYAVGKAAIRNNSYKWRINGRLIVDYRGRVVVEYSLGGEREVGVGCEGKPITVSAYGCDWQLILFQKTFSCWKAWKKPTYKVTMKKGTNFLTSSGSHMLHDVTSISKGDFIQIDNFTITWCE
ncbi:vWA domain-containing protein [Bacteroides bouchesdurhonensis]